MMQTASVLRYHVNRLNETLGLDAGLTFSIEWKVKKEYDSYHRQSGQRTKVTMIIDIRPLPTALHHQPASLADAYDAAPPASSYPAPSTHVEDVSPTMDNPKLLVV